ncbi:LOW QUALITY PROTEIN: gamma-interferon-responsive lysosomal thiol protein [Rhodamnia argentea]|uniref:LOW QUALITY PROTEIN: gamma-interferon-responsive lysosomal thiol protein n=1 Tax=Rhodamnia argentea TaxID=178133 RepID=A0A8B8Q4B1_9MYRT|nr:LOW QUALITY PROTEIN: gamma-interferon-responsive lysosomal thiol protein [Rhodamnia argentea]
MGNGSFSFYSHLVLLLLLLLASPSQSDRRVALSLYYEALCPYCANFIVNSLSKVFDTGLISIVDLRLIPWGNGWISPDGSLSCQHGPDECLLNAIEACAITIYPDVTRHFRFINCVEQLTLQGRHGEWSKCLGTTGLGNAPVDCYNRGYGNKLERRNAQETARLNPPHKFVPWVLVNNRPLQEEFPNFVSYVCKAYRGAHVPAACKSIPATVVSSGEEIRSSSVCYASQARNVTPGLQ